MICLSFEAFIALLHSLQPYLGLCTLHGRAQKWTCKRLRAALGDVNGRREPLCCGGAPCSLLDKLGRVPLGPNIRKTYFFSGSL